VHVDIVPPLWPRVYGDLWGGEGRRAARGAGLGDRRPLGRPAIAAQPLACWPVACVRLTREPGPHRPARPALGGARHPPRPPHLPPPIPTATRQART
jgi:hypothetical protein